MMSKGSGCSGSSAIEYTVRVPKNTTKKYNIMAFNMGDKVNCSTWTRARMERDMSARRMYGEEDSSEGAAASEFGKKQQWQESRRKKYGVVAREFKPEDQPWILRVNGKAGKKFKGQKKSGVTENTCYYIFTQQCPDGAFEAFPLHGWYNFAPLAKHRTLTVEESDEQWGRRNKVVDHFNIMLQRRLPAYRGCGDDEEEEDEKANNKKKAGGGGFLDYHGSLEPTYSDSDSDGGMGEEGKSKVKKARMGKGKASKKSKGSDNEAKEDSDDGDYEGLEVDYMSDRSSSDEEPEKGKPDEGEDVPRGIDETSESEEESEEEQNEEEGKEEEEEEEGKKTPVHGEKKDNNGVSDSSDESDIEGWAASALFLVKKLPPPKRRGSALNASRPGTSSMDSAVTASKLEQGQLQSVVTDTPLAKKQRMEPNCQSPAAFGKGTVPQPCKSTNSSGDTQLTEDAVRRYLIRKPMTTKDLLKKFQTKRTGLSNEQTVNFLAQILKRLNPERKNVNDKMLLYLKE